MTPAETIRELYRAFRDKDDGAFRALCTDDLVWIQNEGFPRGATRHGADAVIEQVFRTFSHDWDSWRFDQDEILEAGDRVVVLGSYSGVHRATGRTCNAPAAHVYDLRGGKVCRFRQFTDTKQIWDAMDAASGAGPAKKR